MIKTYRFYFNLGVPVFDWPTGKQVTAHKWRRSVRNFFAYGLTDATEKFASSVITKHGHHAKLNLEQAFCSVTASPRITHKEDWAEINLDEATLAAFIVGTNARKLLRP